MDKNLFAKTPPMGWNSYDYYDTTVNEEQVRANAVYMAENLKKYGWKYIIIDIEWYARGAGSRRNEYQYIPFSELEMDEYSRLLPDPDRFPSSKDGKGFKPLADYIHSLGLKFGIHIMRGIPRIAAHNHCAILESDKNASDVANPSSICGWNPDMYGVKDCAAGQAYYDSIIALYAEWGVDYIKCDDICNTNIYPLNPYSARHEIEMLHKAILKSGREIVLSLSPGPALIEQAWHYETNANMWRITDDFWDDWKLLLNMFERCELWQRHVSTGCYPDCDMLPIGWLGKGFGEERYSRFTEAEAKTMMSLWCIFGSPLMIGCELTKLDAPTLALLTNSELLSLLSPDYERRQLCRDAAHAVWYSASPKGHEAYIALFNLSDEKQCISSALPEDFTEFRELWTGETGSIESCSISHMLPAHGCCVFKLS